MFRLIRRSTKAVFSLLLESASGALFQCFHGILNVKYFCNDALERRSEFLLEVAIQVLKAAKDIYLFSRTIHIIILEDNLYEETSHHVHVYFATVLDAGTKRYTLGMQVLYFLGERHLAEEELKYHGVSELFPVVFQLPGHGTKP